MPRKNAAPAPDVVRPTRAEVEAAAIRDVTAKMTEAATSAHQYREAVLKDIGGATLGQLHRRIDLTTEAAIQADATAAVYAHAYQILTHNDPDAPNTSTLARLTKIHAEATRHLLETATGRRWEIHSTNPFSNACQLSHLSGLVTSWNYLIHFTAAYIENLSKLTD
jgi:hypothetical protein